MRGQHGTNQSVQSINKKERRETKKEKISSSKCCFELEGAQLAMLDPHRYTKTS